MLGFVSRVSTQKELKMRLRKPKEFTIDRGKWVHGGFENKKKLGSTNLLNDQERMCCLGFYSEACGVPRDDLRNLATPSGLVGVRVPYMTSKHHLGVITNSKLATDLIQINDDLNSPTSPKEKEKLVRASFKEIDVKVRFTGTYPEGVK